MTENNENKLQKISKSDEVMFPTTLKGMKRQAAEILNSGICPKGVDTIAQVLVIGLSGREYNLPMMESLRSLYPINGRVTMSADLMVGLAMRHGHWIEVIEATPEKCVIDFFRKERSDKPYRHTFTMEEARLAGADGKDTFKKWPKLMCLAGCKREGCRIMYPDILHNTLTPDEAGAVMDDEGNVVTVNVFDNQVEIDEIKKQIKEYVDNPDLSSLLFKNWSERQGFSSDVDMTLSMVRTFQQYVIQEITMKHPGGNPMQPVHETEAIEPDKPDTATGPGADEQEEIRKAEIKEAEKLKQDNPDPEVNNHD